MVEADQLACARAAVESGFQDEATFPVTSAAKDDEGQTVESEAPGTAIPATLSRMSSGDERLFAQRLESRSGYRLKVSHTVNPEQRGDVIVNAVRYEILTGFGGEARSTHTRFMLARYA